MSDEMQVPTNALLEITEGPDAGGLLNLSTKTITIGRAPVCDFQLADPYISKKHCQVVFRRDHFTVLDLNSLNKTYVNEKVYLQKNLRNGDLIKIGQTVMKFLWQDLNESVIDALEDVLGADEEDDARAMAGEGDTES